MAMVRKRAMMPSVMSIEIHTAIICVAEAAAISKIAGVMSQVRRAQAARKGTEFDEEEDARVVAAVEAIQEKGSLALVATGAVSDDGIVDPRDTRTVLGMCLSVVRNRPVAGATGYGVFRL